MFDADFLRHVPPAYAYGVLVLGTFLEGETLVIIGGALAHQGYLNPVLVAVCSICGSLASDQLMFTLGRKYGKPFLEARPSLHERAMRATRLVEGRETLIIFGFRFLYGLRNVIPLLLGVRGVEPGKFLLFNTLGAVVWATVFTFVGWLAGTALKTFLDSTDRFHGAFLALLGCVVLVWAAFALWRKFHRPRQPGKAEKR